MVGAGQRDVVRRPASRNAFTAASKSAPAPPPRGGCNRRDEKSAAATTPGMCPGGCSSIQSSSRVTSARLGPTRSLRRRRSARTSARRHCRGSETTVVEGGLGLTERLRLVAGQHAGRARQVADMPGPVDHRTRLGRATFSVSASFALVARKDRAGARLIGQRHDHHPGHPPPRPLHESCRTPSQSPVSSRAWMRFATAKPIAYR